MLTLHIGFKHHFERKHFIEVQESGWFAYYKANKIWEITAKEGKLYDVLLFLAHRFTVKLNADLTFSDLKIKRLLLEQSYLKDFDYKTCPLEFLTHLQSQNYSEATLVTYHNLVVRFLNAFKGKSMDDINRFGINEINQYHELWTQRSAPGPSLINQSVNAIKMYYKVMGKKTLMLEQVTRPMRNKVLPDVYSKEEVQGIVGQITNPKHKAVLFLIYSAGLRISEVINLRKEDLLRDRSLLFIRKSKGRKDRYTKLAVNALQLIDAYPPWRKVVRKNTFLKGNTAGVTPRQAFAMFCTKPSVKPGLLQGDQYTPYDILLPLICLKTELILDTFKNCWDMRALKQQRFIPM
jgi:site-specific recombinase XerD